MKKIQFGVIVLLIGTYSWAYISIPTGEDTDEASRVLKALVAQFEFRGNDHGRPTVYHRAHPRYSEITIGGKYSTEEQNEIWRIAQSTRREKATKAVRIVFFEDGKEVRREVIP